MASPVSPLMEAFWNLASEDEELRCRAAAALVRQLQRAQADFEDQSATTGLLEATADTCCNELAYAAKRLVRGLASSRAASRQGYALCLAELLQAFPCLRAGDVVGQVLQLSQVAGKGGSSKSEQREAMLGKVFGFLALQRSGRLTPTDLSKPDAAIGALAVQITNELFVIAERKSWIADVAHEAVAAVAAAVGPATWTAHVAAAVLSKLPTDLHVWNAEHLGLALAVEELTERWFPGQALAVPEPVAALRAALDPAALRPYHLPSDRGRRGDGDVDAPFDDDDGDDGGERDTSFDSANAPLARAFLSSTASYPQLHSMWGRLLQRYVSGAFSASSQGDAAAAAAAEAGRGAKEGLADVWRVYVDEVLMPNGPERKATALAALSLVARHAPGHPSVLDAVLSRHLVKSLVRNLASRKRILHAPAKAAIAALLAACKGRSAEASTAMLCLLSRGHPNFDKHTGTNTIATLMASLDEASVRAHLAAVRDDFLRPPEDTVAYADAASIATGKTGGTGAEKFGGDNKSSTARSVDGGDDERQGSDDDNDDDDEEEAAANRQRHFTAVDQRRLWAVDTLVGALRNPAVPVLRQQGAILQFISFLALHAFADISVPAAVLDAADAEDAANAAPPQSTSKASSSKRQPALSVSSSPEVATLRSLVRSVGASDDKSLRASASLLVADPPITQPLRDELRARLMTLLHELPKLQLGGGASGSQRRASAAPEGSSVPAVPLPPAWDKCQDRVGAMLQMQVDLSTRVQAVWQAVVTTAAATASTGDAKDEGRAVVATAFPASDSLEITVSRADNASSSSSSSSGSEDESENEEPGDDDDDGESEVGVVPAVLRAAVMDASKALRIAAVAVLQHGRRSSAPAPVSGSAGRLSAATEGARQLLAYAALLSHGGLQILLSPDDQSITAAVADVLGCAPLLLAEALAGARRCLEAAADAEATGGAAGGAVPAATLGKKKAGGKPPRPDALQQQSAGVASTVAPALAALDSLANHAAPYAAQAQAEGAQQAPEEAFLVLVDAGLALLANAGAAVREVVVAALRPLFTFATPAVIDAILRIVIASKSSGAGGDEEGDGDGVDAEDSDAESVTLGSSSLLAPFTAHGGNSGNGDDGSGADDDAEESGSQASADEMARYDRMLSGMLRMRKHARAAASHSRRRALHFKFRALSLLDAAVSFLGHADAGGGGGSPASAAAHRGGPSHHLLLCLPVPLLRTARVLAARARGQAAGSDSSAGDAATLLARVTSLLGRVTKQRVPALTPGSDEAATALAGFAEVLALVPRSPTPEVARAAEGVAGMLLRALRAGSAGAAAAPPSSPGGSLAAQIAPAFVKPVVDAYSAFLEQHFAGKRSNVGAGFLRSAVLNSPVISVSLLPLLARVVADGRVSKVFRLHEAVLALTTMVKSASAPWAAGLPCGVAAPPPPASGRKKQQKATAAATSSSGPAAATTVASALAAAVPALLQAIAAVVAGSAGRRDGAAADSSAAPPPAALPVKQVKDAVALAAQLFKSKLVRAEEAGCSGSAEVAAAEQALFASLEGLLSRFGGKHGVAQQVTRCFELAGRPAPDLPSEAAAEGQVEPERAGSGGEPEAGADNEGAEAAGETGAPTKRKRAPKTAAGGDSAAAAPGSEQSQPSTSAAQAKKKQRK